jgi:hypothetical protein
MKSPEIHENRWNSQPAQPSLASQPSRQIRWFDESMNRWNPRKSIKIDETAAIWDRVKFSLGATSRWQTSAQAAKPPTPEIHEISWNPWKSMKIDEIASQPAQPSLASQPSRQIRWFDESMNLWNPRKSIKIDETAASWDRVKVSLGATSRPQRLLGTRPLKSMKSAGLSRASTVSEFFRISSSLLQASSQQPASQPTSQPASQSSRQIRWIDESMIAASWNRVKLSLGATGWILPFLGTHAPESMKIMKIYENQWESKEIDENRWEQPAGIE